jgi:hypothetical protein
MLLCLKAQQKGKREKGSALRGGSAGHSKSELFFLFVHARHSNLSGQKVATIVSFKFFF